MEPLFRTNVAPYRLGELLVAIAARRLTGRLVLTSDLGERTIYVHSGFPVFTLSSQFSERLGAVGVRYGLLEREDVAAALQLAREKGCEIGRALLELGKVNGTQLFRLLGAQLVEQLAASCGASPARARFLVEPELLDGVVILRMHPMTAVLAAVRHMPSAEHAKMLGAVANRNVANVPMPEPVKHWLADLGFIGDPNTLLAGEANTVTVVRSRLVAKLRASTQQDFDPTASPIPLAVRKEDSVRPVARSVADFLTLALLLSGAITLQDDAKTGSPASPSEDGDAVGSALGAATRSAFSDLPSMPSLPERPVDLAVRAYLEDKRESRTAARLAIWGPAAEVGDDDAVLEQTLALYLTIKPETNDLAVLDVAKNDAPERVIAAHQKYRNFLQVLSDQLTSAHAQARIAELEKRVDDALASLVSSTAREPVASLRAPSASAEAEPTRRSPLPPGATRSSLPPGLDVDALIASVEARVREGNWQKVIELIEPVARGRALPPTLSLAQALAQRELTPRPLARPRIRSIVAFVIGAAALWLAVHFGVVPAMIPGLR